MTILVVDLEATCWATKEEQGSQPNEIIEIGIVELDDDLNFVKSKGYVVKTRFTKISEFCTQLTGWTQEKVDAGLDIAQTLELVEQEFFCNDPQSWCSWGAYDRNKLFADPSVFVRGSLSEIYGIKYSPFTDLYHCNLKEEFAQMYNVAPMGMARALKHLKLKLDGRHHNGEDDAKNIAKIVQKMY